MKIKFIEETCTGANYIYYWFDVDGATYGLAIYDDYLVFDDDREVKKVTLVDCCGRIIEDCNDSGGIKENLISKLQTMNCVVEL